MQLVQVHGELLLRVVFRVAGIHPDRSHSDVVLERAHFRPLPPFGRRPDHLQFDAHVLVLFYQVKNYVLFRLETV